MSDWLSSVLKSAEPASTRPATLGRSAVMKNCGGARWRLLMLQLTANRHRADKSSWRRSCQLRALTMQHPAAIHTAVNKPWSGQTQSAVSPAPPAPPPCARSCAASPCAGARNAAPTGHHGRASWAGPPRPAGRGWVVHGYGVAQQLSKVCGACKIMESPCVRGPSCAHALLPPSCPTVWGISRLAAACPQCPIQGRGSCAGCPLQAPTLCRISRLLPHSVPNSEPLPSITMKPYLQAEGSRAAQQVREGGRLGRRQPRRGVSTYSSSGWHPAPTRLVSCCAATNWKVMFS